MTRFENIRTPQSWIDEVSQDGLALKDFKIQTFDLALTAVQNNWLAIQYTFDKQPAICIEALKQSIDALDYIEIDNLNLKLSYGIERIFCYKNYVNKTKKMKKLNCTLIEFIKKVLLSEYKDECKQIIDATEDKPCNGLYLVKVNDNKYVLHKKENVKVVDAGYIWNNVVEKVDDKAVMKFEVYDL